MTTALTLAERTLLTERLTAAETALHEILLGRQVKTFVDQSGERVEYQLMSKDALRAYILELRVRLGLSSVTGPLRPWML